MTWRWPRARNDQPDLVERYRAVWAIPNARIRHERSRRRYCGARPRSEARETRAIVKHAYVGFLNPHCQTCGRTPMEVSHDPARPCRRVTIENVPTPDPVKAEPQQDIRKGLRR